MRPRSKRTRKYGQNSDVSQSIRTTELTSARKPGDWIHPRFARPSAIWRPAPPLQPEQQRRCVSAELPDSPEEKQTASAREDSDSARGTALSANAQIALAAARQPIGTAPTDRESSFRSSSAQGRPLQRCQCFGVEEIFHH
jgi:hypothetical protein